MFGRKGQSAMEYLMTYGWAILVVMVVGIAMWRLGIFNLGGTPMTSTGFAKIKPQLSASGITGIGNATLVFTNGAGAPIYLGGSATSVGINITISGQSCNGIANYGGSSFPTWSTCVITTAGCGPIATGDNFRIELDGCKNGASGTPFMADITLDYLVTIGSVTNSHRESGSIRGPYE